MIIKTRRKYVVMKTKNILIRVSNLPKELMKIIYLYIPDRVPFKDELIEKMKSEWYECSQYSFPPHQYVLKKISINHHKLIKFPNTNDTFLFYRRLNFAFIKNLKEIAKTKKIKGRSKLKTHNDFISTFLKNDVYISYSIY